MCWKGRLSIRVARKPRAHLETIANQSASPHKAQLAQKNYLGGALLKVFTTHGHCMYGSQTAISSKSSDDSTSSRDGVRGSASHGSISSESSRDCARGSKWNHWKYGSHTAGYCASSISTLASDRSDAYACRISRLCLYLSRKSSFCSACNAFKIKQTN